MAKFQKGHKIGHHGFQPGAGRKPNWYKEKCDTIIRKGNLFNLLGKIAQGIENRKFKTTDGKTLILPPGFADRIRAITELRDTAYGKPNQHVDVTNDAALMDLLSAVSLLLKQKVPRVCGHCKKDLGILEILAREFEEMSARFTTKNTTTTIPSAEDPE